MPVLRPRLSLWRPQAFRPITPLDLPASPIPRSAPRQRPLFAQIQLVSTMPKLTDTDYQEKLRTFQVHLASSTRILTLVGAGLSAASGLPTFRGRGGMWRQHEATSLATPEAFGRDPGLVWQFYAYRRRMALQAKPNPAHYALAELAKQKSGFITLSQNVDGML